MQEGKIKTYNIARQTRVAKRKRKYYFSRKLAKKWHSMNAERKKNVISLGHRAVLDMPPSERDGPGSLCSEAQNPDGATATQPSVGIPRNLRKSFAADGY